MIHPQRDMSFLCTKSTVSNLKLIKPHINFSFMRISWSKVA